jgi:hypothetical protein
MKRMIVATVMSALLSTVAFAQVKPTKKKADKNIVIQDPENIGGQKHGPGDDIIIARQNAEPPPSLIRVRADFTDKIVKKSREIR